MTAKSAIVLGASGSVGQALITELVRCGEFDHVIVVTRRPLGLQIDQQLNVQVEECLVPDMVPTKLSQAVVNALSGVTTEVVGFSVLGIGANTAKLTLDEHRAVDVELNKAFAQGLKESGKVNHFCFMSAIGADINAKSTGSGAAGLPRYARVKGESEAAVIQHGPAIVSIFRPAVIVGSQHTPSYLPAVLSLVTWLMPARYHSIRTTEIAQSMVAAAVRTPAKSEVYHYPEMMKLIEA